MKARAKKRALATVEVKVEVDTEAEIKARKAAKAAEAGRRLQRLLADAEAKSKAKKAAEAKQAAEAEQQSRLSPVAPSAETVVSKLPSKLLDDFLTQKKKSNLQIKVAQSKMQSKLLQAEFAAQAVAESSTQMQALTDFLEIATVMGLSREVIMDHCEEWCINAERMVEHHLADEARLNRKAHDERCKREDLEAGRGPESPPA